MTVAAWKHNNLWDDIEAIICLEVSYMNARVCECVCAHWVNIYEEAVVFLIWREPMHVVQQHRVSIEKVRVGDEDRRVWRYSTKQKQREARRWKYVYTDKRGRS